MRLRDAREELHRAIREAAKPAVASAPLHQHAVSKRDGVVTLDEVRRLSQGRLPAVQCAVLGRSEDGYGSAGLRLAAFVLARSSMPAPEETLEVLDLVERMMREMAAPGRKLLSVRTRALYEPEMAAIGSFTLWAVTATMPELAAVPDGTRPGGVFAAANSMLGPVLDRVLGTAPAPGTPETPEEEARRLARRGMTARDRSASLIGDDLPFAAVVHSPGRETQEGAGSGQMRWTEGEGEGLVVRQQAVRGQIAWTVTVSLWAGTDAQADTLAAELMRRLPDQWVYLAQSSRVRVGEVTPADYSELHGASRATVEIRLKAVSPRGDAAQVPLIRERGITTTCQTRRR